jgi:hypothetical protein
MFSAYVLGIKSNFRGVALIEQLELYGIFPNIVWGPQVEVDRIRIAQHTNQEFANFAIGRDIKPEEIACCLGHIEMYENFHATESEWGLFLEDDAIPLLDPISLIKRLPTSDEPLQIFLHDGPGTNLRFRQDKELKKLDLTRRLDPQYGAYGYLLNRSAVSKILNSPIREFINTPDWPYFWPRQIKYFVSSEVYFSHPKDLSISIIGERINKEAKLINQIPRWSKITEAQKFSPEIQTLLYKEFSLKLLRIFLQIWKRISK